MTVKFGSDSEIETEVGKEVETEVEIETEEEVEEEIEVEIDLDEDDGLKSPPFPSFINSSNCSSTSSLS